MRHCVATATSGCLGVLRVMQYWKVFVLCGLAVGTTVTWCRPQTETQINPQVNLTGSEILVESRVRVTVVSVGSFLILQCCLLGFGEPGELALCDCEFATGPPDGLSCDKEGWFISNFERQGSWVGPVSLSTPLAITTHAQVPAAFFLFTVYVLCTYCLLCTFYCPSHA